MKRALVSGAAVVTVLALGVSPAAAHSEWEPSTAEPGSVAQLTLFVEDEQPDAATTTVELVFPEELTIAELPEVAGWTATAVDGEVGGPATGVTWSGGSEPDDVELPIELGPLPDDPGRLQFKVVQTYDNGEVDRWIDDWPAGEPEPESPGPVLELAATGTGTTEEATDDDHDNDSTTVATSATNADGEEAAAADDDSDSNALPIAIVVVVVLAAGAAAVFVIRSRRSDGT